MFDICVFKTNNSYRYSWMKKTELLILFRKSVKRKKRKKKCNKKNDGFEINYFSQDFCVEVPFKLQKEEGGG